ncbi:MAG: hypothetical protein JWO25_1331, partial [Alphaproteobacteria bacterium]|nr:hypothetical protein [Alphaproteobacteria bacterium]
GGGRGPDRERSGGGDRGPRREGGERPAREEGGDPEFAPAFLTRGSTED